MYISYWVNTLYGRLFRSGQPSDNPTGNGWKEISLEEFKLLECVASYAWHGYYDFTQKPE